MSIRSFIDAVEPREHTLTLYNRQDPDPIVNLLDKTFASENVEVREAPEYPMAPVNLVALENETDDLAVATSNLTDVRETLLLVNSDLYVTGTKALDEVETPEIVAALDDTTLTVADKSKFLMIHISRHVEALALETDGGSLHTGFQDLSRVNAERGTKTAYERLGDSDVDVHVYGRDDWAGSPAAGITAHPATEGEITKSWFVVHDGDGADERKAALVATETDANEYRGFWTFKPDLVDEVAEYFESEYC